MADDRSPLGGERRAMDGIWILGGWAGLLAALALSCDVGSGLARKAEIRRGRLPRPRPKPKRAARQPRVGRAHRDPPEAPRGRRSVRCPVA